MTRTEALRQFTVGFSFNYHDLVVALCSRLIMVQRCCASYFPSFPLAPIISVLLIFIVDRVTEVKTDIYVTSFGPVSDADMVKYSCFISNVMS